MGEIQKYPETRNYQYTLHFNNLFPHCPEHTADFVEKKIAICEDKKNRVAEGFYRRRTKHRQRRRRRDDAGVTTEGRWIVEEIFKTHSRERKLNHSNTR
ncbi:hypothetical protein LWI28_023509 [Acer negundo]|uniref:Uncharacterized protein n=1 Tax=Acer negundo TaxID=4023 RepID=A0AAD5J177_ACENE|nr:hypothetical protein LWI28_023509 [Acer negundo]KAK4848912.1 hypothetical protein QYF36_018570 [Acer negundo]